MSIWSFIKKLFRKNKKLDILIIGLDNAGKTTILNNLKGKNSETFPTIGTNSEVLIIPGFKVNLFDLSGNGTYRSEWEKYYKKVDGIIFVLDSSDIDRKELAAYEFEYLINNPIIKNNPIPILIFSNKMDKIGSLDYTKGAQLLKLELLEGKNWHLQRTNALKSEGIKDGFEWLLDQLDN